MRHDREQRAGSGQGGANRPDQQIVKLSPRL
jgi:hypothetical protein